MTQSLADELAEFAGYCRSVASDSADTRRAVWLNRAVWADNCAAKAQEAEDEVWRLRMHARALHDKAMGLNAELNRLRGNDGDS